MKRFRWAIIVMFTIAVLLSGGYAYKKYKARHQLTGKAAPEFTLPLLHNSKKQFSSGEMKGKVWLLNVWASWCGECAAEHPVLMELAKQKIVPVYGINYWDTPEKGIAWLERHGNPYEVVMDGSAGFDYGIRGVPDTFVIDKQGVIQYVLIGQVTAENIRNKILPLVAELEKR